MGGQHEHLASAASFDIVSAEVERALQDEHAISDGIDTKGGLVLGFASVLVALGRDGSWLLVSAGRIMGALAALLAMSTVFPWSRPQLIKLRRLHSGYLSTDPVIVRHKLLWFRIAFNDFIRLKNHQRRWMLRLSVIMLSFAVLVTSLGLILG